MAATIGTLETEVGKSRAYLERVDRHQDQGGARVAGPRRLVGCWALRSPSGIVGTCRVVSSAASSAAVSGGARGCVRRAPRPDQRRPARVTGPGRGDGRRGGGPRARRLPGPPGRPGRARHHPPACQPRRGQPAGVLGDGDRDRLPPGGGGRLPAAASAVRRHPPGRPGQVLADGPHRPARPARGHDGQGLRRRVPRGRRRPGGSRQVPGGEVRVRLGGGALDVGSAPGPADARLTRVAADARTPVGLRLQPPAGREPDEPVERASSPPRTPTLAEAVDAVAELASAAGADAAAARAEALALAAAVAESAPGAAADWARAVGGATTQDFFDAASRGRRWREAPTATLSALAAQGSPHATAYAQALAEVASAACELGEPTMRVVGNASVAAAAQLARRAAPADRRPGCRPPAVAGRTPAGDLPGAGVPSRRLPDRGPDPAGTGHPAERSRRAAGRARRPDRAAAGQAGDPPAGRAAARGEAARGRRPEEPHPDPSPGVHGQPRHRQDHGRAAGRAASTRPWVCCRAATWSRSTAPSSWRATWARPRPRRPTSSHRRLVGCSSSTRPTA